MGSARPHRQAAHARAVRARCPAASSTSTRTIEALEAAIDDTVAALFVEPIKGEAGVIDLPDGYLRARPRAHRTQHGVLLIIDEIQTGAGRTGELVRLPARRHPARRHHRGQGHRRRVCRSARWSPSARASDLFTRGQHGSTFGGNPLVTATANAVLGEIERDGLVAERGPRAASELREVIAAHRLAADRARCAAGACCSASALARAGRRRARRRGPRARAHRQRRRTTRASGSRRR